MNTMDKNKSYSTLGKSSFTSNQATHRIYLDNAATTPMDPEVVEAMLPYLTTYFGNPSSIYSYGRETRLALENARKTVASILGVRPEVYFSQAEELKVTIPRSPVQFGIWVVSIL